jgi:hypothetical protein
MVMINDEDSKGLCDHLQIQDKEKKKRNPTQQKQKQLH